MVKRQRIGVVLEKTSSKTASVIVKRKRKHFFYLKMVTTIKKYIVHNENFEVKKGSIVIIEECAPISKKKRWTIKSVVALR